MFNNSVNHYRIIKYIIIYTRLANSIQYTYMHNSITVIVYNNTMENF